jgi:hypothetical protein
LISSTSRLGVEEHEIGFVLKMWSRMGLFLAEMLTAVPGLKSDLIGAILFSVIFAGGFRSEYGKIFLLPLCPR